MNLTYASIMTVAVTAGYVLSRCTQRDLPVGRWERLGIGLGAFCGAMIGAKLPFALGDWDGFKSGMTWFSDGKTIMTGLVGGYFGVEVAKWSLHVSVKTGDTFAVPVAVAISIGRLACFAGGCCFGTACSLPWGVDFGDGVRRHPTQIYESLFHLTAAMVLCVLRRHGLFQGQLIKFYFLSYFAYRFLTEFIRPERELCLGLTAFQFAALGLFVLFSFLWARDRNSLCFPRDIA